VADPVRLPWPRAEAGEGELRGETLAADPFGNLVTSIRDGDLGGAQVARAEVDGRAARWVRTFAEGGPGELLAMVGSGGRVEIAVREGSAAAVLGRARGAAVRLVLVGPAGSAC
jgi:S-adenosylmethionine hydrolase